jgi:nitrite reductase/ring-hydroxylating ferredoxin subunit
MNQNTTSIQEVTRRHLMKQFILGSASVLCGTTSSSRIFAEVLPTGPGPGVLRLKASDYPALANPGGSIQLRFIDYLPPLTLNRVTSDRYVTLDSVCTHQGCTVSRFIVANGRMRCPCHGSRYDIEGRVFRDANGDSTEPADADLNRYATLYDAASDTLSITIPDLALHINSISVHQANPNGQLRLKLTIPTSYGAIYEIRHQPDLQSPSVPISFSLTPAGIANQQTLGPLVYGDINTYIDATGSKGFFTVELKLTEVVDP